VCPMSESPRHLHRARDSQEIESSLAILGRHNIGVLLQQLSRNFERRARSTLGTRGHGRLQPSHQVVLTSLGLEGSRLTALAQRAGMTKQAMGQIVDDLERLGYVERTPDPGDGRAKIVRFTPAGLDFVCDSAEVITQIWGDYAALIGEKELCQLQQTLRSLWRGARTSPGER
jgi:DNA-binding MarR family transcriptional regulator